MLLYLMYKTEICRFLADCNDLIFMAGIVKTGHLVQRLKWTNTNTRQAYKQHLNPLRKLGSTGCLRVQILKICLSFMNDYNVISWRKHEHR